MKKFNQFINESIRDKMTPKSEDDIKKSLEKLSPKEKIEKAIKYNIIWVAQEAIDNGVDITGTTKGGYHFGQRLLDDAIKKGHVDMAKFLLKNGVDLRKSDLADSLENAVSNNRLEMVKFLIEKGADANA